MKHITLILYISVLTMVLLTINILLDPLIGPPFGWEDVISIAIFFPVYVVVFLQIRKLLIRHKGSFWSKVGMTVVAFIVAVILLILLDNLWFELTGNILFKLYCC